MRVLDLFCGAGGASMGWHLAGHDVTGVDLIPQPHYPFTFHQADALTYPLDGFDVIHASPPCQRYTPFQQRWNRDHPDLIAPIRRRLLDWGTAWVIENVPGAPLAVDLTLCGSMFGLQVKRHRIFELGGLIALTPPPCDHRWEGGHAVGVYGHTGRRSTRDGPRWLKSDWERAMGIDWMSRDELAQAIPPAYTRWIAERLLP